MPRRVVTIALFAAIAACGRIGYDAVHRVDDGGSEAPSGQGGTGGASDGGSGGRGDDGGAAGAAVIDANPGDALGGGGIEASAGGGAGGAVDAAGGAADGDGGVGGGTVDAAGGTAGSGSGGVGGTADTAGGAATGGTTTNDAAIDGTAADGVAADGADTSTDYADAASDGISSGGGVDGDDTSVDPTMDGDSSDDTIKASDSDGSDIPSGYVDAWALGDCRSSTYGTHTYVFCNVKVDWTTARDNCASLGMHLARVDDAAENQYLYDSMYVSNPKGGIWIGGNDIAVEGEWRWADGSADGTLFWRGDFSGAPQNGLYNAWYAARQPSAQVPEKDCAVLDSARQAGWYDYDCTLVLEYACESQ